MQRGILLPVILFLNTAALAALKLCLASSSIISWGSVQGLITLMQIFLRRWFLGFKMVNFRFLVVR